MCASKYASTLLRKLSTFEHWSASNPRSPVSAVANKAAQNANRGFAVNFSFPVSQAGSSMLRTLALYISATLLNNSLHLSIRSFIDNASSVLRILMDRRELNIISKSPCSNFLDRYQGLRYSLPSLTRFRTDSSQVSFSKVAINALILARRSGFSCRVDQTKEEQDNERGTANQKQYNPGSLHETHWISRR